jgi:hypothetical protein
MTMKNKGLKFNGGEGLEGLEKKVHEAMMQTELHNGYGAYELSYAGGKSGLSFGGNQMDMGQKGENFVEGVFVDILRNARDAGGQSLLSESEKSALLAPPNLRSEERQKFYKKYTEKGVTPQQMFGDLLPKVNAALSSDYGVKVINEQYRNEIRGSIEHVKDIIAKTENHKVIEQITLSDEWMLRFVDYHNQYGFSQNENMFNLLKHGKVELKNINHDPKAKSLSNASGRALESGRYEVHLDEDGLLTVAIFKDFIRHTEQYRKSEQAAKAQENRLNKIDKLLGQKAEPRPNVDYDLVYTHGTIVLGDERMRSLQGDGAKFVLSGTLNVELSRLKKCIAYINYDDHIRVLVNNKQVHTSVPGGGNLFQVVKVNGVNYVDNGVGRVQAETGQNHYYVLDLRPHLQNGFNQIVQEVIVQHLGNSSMRIEYTNASLKARL